MIRPSSKCCSSAGVSRQHCWLSHPRPMPIGGDAASRFLAATAVAGAPAATPAFGPSWGLGWRRGPIRRLFLGRYRWYPVSWGSWSCCSSSTWEPCCNEVAYDSPSATVIAPDAQKPTLAPQRPAAPAPGPSRSIEEEFNLPLEKSPTTPKKSSNPSTSDEKTRGQSGLLSVHVPAAAKVYINGRETRTVGTHREYVSLGLKEGKIYPYTVRALVLASGYDGQSDSQGRRWVWITKTAYLKAGDSVGVTFSENLDLESNSPKWSRQTSAEVCRARTGIT